MRRLFLSVTATCAVLMMAFQPVAVAAKGRASVLFDFGDGTYLWAEVELGDNRTAFNATLHAADSLSLTVEYQWFSFGVMVQDIGGHHPSYPLWWHLLLWNRNESSWKSSPVGAADVLLGDGDAIAWFLAMDNPATFASPIPVPTPPHPYPHPYYRHDLMNSGHHPGSLCRAPSLSWEFDTGAFEISGTPAAANGRIFVPTWTGLFALKEDDGSLVWKRTDIAGMSSPAIFNSGLFIGARDGRLHYVAESDGEDLWNVSLISSPVFTGIASSPKPYLDRVFVGLFNESGGNGGVAAVSIWNGTVLWRHDSASVHMSSPAIRGDTLYVGVAGHFNSSTSSFLPPYGLLALNSTDGSERWFFETDGPVVSSPVIHYGIIFFTSRDGFVHGVDYGGIERWLASIGPSTSSLADGTSLMFVGDGLLGEQGHLRAFSSNLHEVWNVTFPGPIQSSPFHVDGMVFVSTNEEHGTVYALDAENGTILWSFTPTPGDYILSYPMVADGRLFVASDNGFVYSFVCPTNGGASVPPQTDAALMVLVVVTVVAAVVVVAVLVYLLRRKSA